MRRTAALALAATMSVIVGCETLSPEERQARYQAQVDAYEQSVRERFVGKPSDELVLTLGPPSSTFKLSDGRDVFQYDMQRTTTSGGESYTSYQTVTRERRVRDANGTVRVIEEQETVPVTNVSPIRTHHAACTRRFVVGADRRVESFRWEGNACF